MRIKVSAYEWFSNVSETSSNLGLNNRVKKRYESTTEEDTISDISPIALTDFKDSLKIAKKIAEYAKNLYDGTSKVKVNVYGAFKTNISLTAIESIKTSLLQEFKPELKICVAPHSKVVYIDIDFNVCPNYTTSTSFNKREIPLVDGIRVEDAIGQIANCIYNFGKIANVDPSKFPPQWDEDEFTRYMVGFRLTSKWKPQVYSQPLSEHQRLGLGNRVKKRFEDKSQGDGVFGVTIDDYQSSEEQIKTIADYAKRLYADSSMLKVTSRANKTFVLAPIVETSLGLKIRPKLVIEANPDNTLQVSIDFMVDTAGSGSFFSRVMQIGRDIASEMKDRISNCLENMKKLAAMQGNQFPQSWDKKEFSNLIAGFDTSSWTPRTQTQEDTLSKDKICQWLSLPKYERNGGLDYVMAISDLLDSPGCYVEFVVRKFRLLDDPEISIERSTNRMYFKEFFEGKVFEVIPIVVISARSNANKKKRSYDLIVNGYDLIEDFDDKVDLALDGSLWFDRKNGKSRQWNAFKEIEGNPETISRLVPPIQYGSKTFGNIPKKLMHFFVANAKVKVVIAAKKKLLSMIKD